MVVDARSPRDPTTLKHTVAQAVRPFMPKRIQRIIDARPGAAPGLRLTEAQLRTPRNLNTTLEIAATPDTA
jgi:hypothetical protein